MAEDNPNEGMSGKMKAVIAALGSFATVLSLNHRQAGPVTAIPQEQKPIVQTVPGLPVETTGMKINYSPLPSSSPTTVAVANAKAE